MSGLSYTLDQVLQYGDAMMEWYEDELKGVGFRREIEDNQKDKTELEENNSYLNKTKSLKSCERVS